MDNNENINQSNNNNNNFRESQNERKRNEIIRVSQGENYRIGNKNSNDIR